MAVPNQRDDRELARIAGPGAYVAETGNAKMPCIGLGEEAYKGKATAFEPGCNTCGERLEWSSFCVKPPVSF